MKKPFRLAFFSRFLFFPFIGIVFFSSCMQDDKKYTVNQMITLDDRSMGSPLEITIGQSFSVQMRNPASGGYLFREPEFAKNILQMQDQQSISPPENSKIAGDFGRMIYIFKAVASGNTEIVFRIYRPWEHDVPAQEYQRVKVVVAP